MSTPTGKFVWYEYMGDDRRAAAEFYTNVVGWSAKDAGMAGFPYEILSTGDHMVAGMMDIPTDAKAMGARPSWMGYIWVEDVDAALPKLVAAGGKVFKEPADIPGVGRFAVVSDPYGGVFMLFRDHGGTPPPPPPPGTPGLVGWHELHADDGAKALVFYSRLLRLEEDRRIRHGPDRRLSHVRNRTRPTGRDHDPHAADADVVLALLFQRRRSRRGGRADQSAWGQIINGPHEVPGGQWIVQATDPQGAMFALVASSR